MFFGVHNEVKSRTIFKSYTICIIPLRFPRININFYTLFSHMKITFHAHSIQNQTLMQDINVLHASQMTILGIKMQYTN